MFRQHVLRQDLGYH